MLDREGRSARLPSSSVTVPRPSIGTAASQPQAQRPQQSHRHSATGGTDEERSSHESEFCHPFWFVNKNMPPEYWNYEEARFDFNSGEPYELIQKIGRGKYSEVFRSLNRNNGELCVLKILKPVRLKKIRREITVLQNLCGGPNIVRLLDIVNIPVEDTPVLVMENIEPADNFRSLTNKNCLSNFDMRYYLYELLRGLNFAHSRGIFHRDIKPHNVIIEHRCRKLRIIDWGLAEYYLHGLTYNVGVGTRHFKGPELLVGYRLYDYSLDIWSVGCILAEMLFGVYPFFRGDDNEDQLVQIVNVLGSEDLVRYITKYNIHVPRHIMDRGVCGKRARRPWCSFVTPANISRCDVHALDLLDKMLRIDHQERILASDAMNHPFFDPIRAVLQKDPQEQYPIQAHVHAPMFRVLHTSQRKMNDRMLHRCFPLFTMHFHVHQISQEGLQLARRAAFSQYMHQQNAAFTGAGNVSTTAASNEMMKPFKRHVMETIEVKPTISEGNKSSEEDRFAKSQTILKTKRKSHVSRGERDLRELQRHAAVHMDSVRQQQLRKEYKSALRSLSHIHRSLRSLVVPGSRQQQQQQQLCGSSNHVRSVLATTEAVQFKQFHLLRDTTARLTAAHMKTCSVDELFDLLQLLSRIVSLSRKPHVTAHGYAVRLVLDTLFSPSRSDSFTGTQYYQLIQVMLSLPAEQSVEVQTEWGPLAVEVLCVRQLARGAAEKHYIYLQEIGSVRAVRVVGWCMQCSASLSVVDLSHQRRPTPSRGDLRFPFALGKEYVQEVLSLFACCGKKNPGNTNPQETLSVVELATLCTAIVFYEVATPEALTVLVEAAPMCAIHVDILSGHQLSCVMLAYATLKYHGDLSQHPMHSSSEANRVLSKSLSGTEEHKVCQGNFYLLLGQRAGDLGEHMREDDAARVLRALEMAGVEHEMLRRSLGSSMRMKKLHRKSLLF